MLAAYDPHHASDSQHAYDPQHAYGPPAGLPISSLLWGDTQMAYALVQHPELATTLFMLQFASTGQEDRPAMLC